MADNTKGKPGDEDELDSAAPMEDVGDAAESEWEDSIGDKDPEEDF